jgi:hypothetical protein
MATYNGHKNWNYWNVFLWINNDEGLYGMARDLKRRHGSRDGAKAFVEQMQAEGMGKTPDGAAYTQTSVVAAMRDM